MMDQGRGPVPLEFEKLVEATVDDPALRGAISNLVSAKSAGPELD